jgi:PAS domain S-box-containing protein
MEIYMEENEFIISKTDPTGKITYGNETFIRMSGYTEDELLYKPHNILRHPQMPRVVFKLLWDTISQGKHIYAYVINQTKTGDHYWVFASVTPSFDHHGHIIGYHSVRRKPSNKAKETIIPIYEKLLQAERSGGMNASAQRFGEILEEAGVSYDEFIYNVQ